MAADVLPRGLPGRDPAWRELWLLPLVGPEGGGLLLKQRNRRGDRSTLIWEALPPDPAIGFSPAVWDEHRRVAGGVR